MTSKIFSATGPASNGVSVSTWVEIDVDDPQGTTVHMGMWGGLNASKPVWDVTNSDWWDGLRQGSYGGPAVYIESAQTFTGWALNLGPNGKKGLDWWGIQRQAKQQHTFMEIGVGGITYAGQNVFGRCNITIPPLAPVKPASVSTTPTYDDGLGNLCTMVDWVPGSGGGDPFSWYVWRWDVTRGTIDWAHPELTFILAMDCNDTGDATGYKDTSLEDDNHYIYAISAYNYWTGTDGRILDSYPSKWTYNTTDVWTMPFAPSNVQVVRSGVSAAKLTAVNQSQTATGFEWFASSDGWNTSTSLGTTGAVAKGSTTTFTTGSLDPTKAWEFGVIALTGDSTTFSRMSVAATKLILITRPSAPVRATSGTVDRASLVLTAEPSTTVLPDGSALRKFEMRWRLAGTTAWTVETGTSPLQVDLTGKASSPSVLDTQWRVWGAWTGTDGPTGDGSSDWSGVSTVKVSASPQATVTAPTNGEVLSSSTYTLVSSGFDPASSGIVAARYTLTDTVTGKVIGSSESSTDLTGWTWTGIPDGAQVQGSVAYRNADGLWGKPATRDNAVKYTGPADPVVETTWNADDGSILWRFTPVSADGHPDAVYLDIYATISGKRTLLARHLSPSGTWRQAIAPLVTTNYEIVSFSALPSSSTGFVAVVPPDDVRSRFYLNGGPGGSWVASGTWNVDMVVKRGRVREVSTDWVQSEYGIEFIYDPRVDQRKVTFDALKDGSAHWSEFHRIQEYPGDLMWRDPYGAGSMWACSVEVPETGLSHADRFPAVSLLVTRVGGAPSIDEVIEDASQPDPTVIYANRLP